MTIHYRVTWELVSDPSAIVTSSIGGCPALPAGESWPICTEDNCGKRMSLFVQFATDDSPGLPFGNGSVLNIFQCIEHDDPFEALDTLAPKRPHDKLLDKYWEHANYAMFLVPPEGQQRASDREPFVAYAKLILTPEKEPAPRSREALNYRNIKVGGSPFWVQRPKIWNCSCGAEMAFVCSLPSNLLYPKAEGSPRQPNGRADGHFLFLGLSSYVFACRARCHPQALVAIRQN